VSNSIRSLLVDLEKRFQNAQIDSARTDAELIVAHVLGVSRSGLSLLQEITPEMQREIERLCQLRQQRIPLQHLTGEQGFRKLVLKVGAGVFIPRPETELLVESTIRELKDLPSAKILDLCSGSGAIAISLASELSNAHVTAVEVSDQAFGFLQTNASNYQPQITAKNSNLELLNKDVTEITFENSSFDAVVANPPYIPEAMVPKDPEVALHDPKIALYSGRDGLDLIRIIIDKATDLLKPGGWIAIEHSDLQGDANVGVPGLLKMTEKFENIEDRRDLNGLPRYCVAKRKI
jgi:release factor glutamine methyltransferase